MLHTKSTLPYTPALLLELKFKRQSKIRPKA